MRCMSCGANIPPEWVMAIQSNTCPGCGNEIMNEPTQQLLKELSEAMEKMPNDPQGVAGWLLSNYRFQKMGEGAPVEKFHRQGSAPGGGADPEQMKMDPTYNDFIKRGEASEAVARSKQLEAQFGGMKGGEKFAEMAAAIRQVGDPYGDDTTEQESSVPDAEEQKAMMELQAQGLNPFADTPVGGITDLTQAINPQDVASLLTSQQDGPLKEEQALANTEMGRNYLARDRFKRMKAQDAISGGGGSFRR